MLLKLAVMYHQFHTRKYLAISLRSVVLMMLMYKIKLHVSNLYYYAFACACACMPCANFNRSLHFATHQRNVLLILVVSIHVWVFVSTCKAGWEEQECPLCPEMLHFGFSFGGYNQRLQEFQYGLSFLKFVRELPLHDDWSLGENTSSSSHLFSQDLAG